jgi:hypothetical protein
VRAISFKKGQRRMGCEKSKCEDSNLPPMPQKASPEQEQVWALAQQTSDLLQLECRLRLDFVMEALKASGLQISITGPGALRWFKMETKTTAQITSPQRPSLGKLEADLNTDYVISTNEGESRLQLNHQRSSASSVKYMLLHIDGNGESTLMYSIAHPTAAKNNPEMVIQAQSPGKELPQVRYAASTGNSFSLLQEGKLACQVSNCQGRAGSRYESTIEPGMNVLLHVGLVCAVIIAAHLRGCGTASFGLTRSFTP